jgi:hypothetical protein
MSLFERAISRYREAPYLLRLMAAASIALGIGAPLMTTIPIARFNIDGTEMTWEEIWRNHLALAILMLGMTMLAIGVNILRRRQWVRPAIIALPALQYLPFQMVHWAFKSSPDPVPPIDLYLLIVGLWALVSSIYLYGFRSVRDYFSVGTVPG